MIKKAHGRICEVCGDFTKSIIICEICRKKMCRTCAGNDFLCKEHFIVSRRASISAEYFKEKYQLVNDIEN